MLSQNLRGEMSVKMDANASIMDHDLIDGVARTLTLSTSDEIKKLKEALFPTLFCAASKSGDIPAMEKMMASVSSDISFLGFLFFIIYYFKVLSELDKMADFSYITCIKRCSFYKM